MNDTQILLTKESVEKISYPCVISLREKNLEETRHKIFFYNTYFLKTFIFNLKEENVSYLEEIFGPVFESLGLTFFTFENRFYYLFNIPLNSRHTLHIFIEEKEWLKFPHWINTQRLASLGKLAGEISHELKNPLSGILLYATMLKEELGSSSPYSEWLERITYLANKCKGIINALLNFGKPEKTTKAWVDINQVIKKVYEILSGYPIFNKVKFIWKLKDNLPLLYANQGQLEQVFFNLFINAAQAMKGEGEITVETFIRYDNIIVRIKDTGPGIPSEVMPFIFDPFFTTKDKSEASGLGLSICYGIVKNHGGQIRAYNLKEKGACFEISFPLQTREALREDEV